MVSSINFLVFKTWLEDQIKVCFNPLADIANQQDLGNEGRLLLHKLTNSITQISSNKSESCR